MKTWVISGLACPNLYVRADEVFDAIKKAREVSRYYNGGQLKDGRDTCLDMIIEFRCNCDCETCAYRRDADDVDDDLRERTDAWAEILGDDDPVYCAGHTEKYATEDIMWSVSADFKLTVWTHNRKGELEPRVYDLDEWDYYVQGR